MKVHRTIRSAVGLGIVAVLSAGVATVVAGANSESNGTPDAAASSVRVGAQSPTESNFVSVTPCRLVDTRQPGAGGTFAEREVRNYRTQGITAGQGGTTNCNIPATASALELSVTAVGARSTGFLRLYPAGGSEPNATFMNYTPSFNVSNAGTVAVTPGTGNNLKVRAYGRGTHVVIEVLGYYVQNPMAVVNADGTLSRGTAGATVTREDPGVYRVNFNRNLSGCAYAGGLHDPGAEFGRTGYLALARNGVTPNGVYVETFNTAGSYADRDFHLTVTC